ncbi:ABC transporter substrate-binding protein [Caldibacillus lycopersici]|uniref:ABC transporter substrate-binding protein n=1 Tax=Perspicuibacillus lycopersici TaxID=1325689 RepID=A0AAE3IVW5_9BACI|nr:ABC transporter substrate-binding protein [Perspicuibacillus lycopersici]MCU9614359.1 ABC transporter substrate-binding protein [Perspicuibacillus lycopersici]
MKLIEYYLYLFAKFSKCIAFQKVILTRSKISNELQCTERTVTNILNKMVDKKWIIRNKGEGRGNSTTIIFLKTIEEMLDYFESESPTYDDMMRIISLFEINSLSYEKEQVYSSLISKLFGIEGHNISMENDEENDYAHLKIPYFRPFNSLDPSAVERQSERHMVEQIFNTLVSYNQENEKVVPCISYYWEQANEGKEWIFYLRKGIYFHNNHILTSNDVKFSFERLWNTDSRWIVKHLKNIDCVGKHVIRFEFSQPMYCWDLILTSPKCSIVPENYGGKSKKEFTKSPIGTGPYMVKNHDNNVLNLMVHLSYFKGRAYIDEISFFVLPTIEKYFHAKKMELEPLLYIPFSVIDDGDSDYHYIQRNNLSVKYLMWNMNKANIRSNISLRNRVAAIIHKEKMVKELGYPRFQKASSFSGEEYVYESPSLNSQGQTSFNETMTLMTYELTPNEDDIKWLQAEFAKHSIELHIIQVPYSSFIEQSKQADLVLSEFVSENSLELSLYNLFLSESSVFTNLCNLEEVYQLVDRAKREKREGKRIEWLKKLEGDLMNQNIIVPLYSTFQKALFHKDLMGISLSTIGLVPFERLFFR